MFVTMITEHIRKEEIRMIAAIDLKAGMTFEQGNKLIKVLEANHHKPGKGNTVMRMKLKDVRSGAVTDTTMRPDEKVKKSTY